MNCVAAAFVLFVTYIFFFDTIVNGDDECETRFPHTDPSGNPTMIWNKNVKRRGPCCTSVLIYAALETLCPFCAKWVVENVCPYNGRFPPLTTGLVSCMHIEPIIFGVRKRGSCQHGPEECKMNANMRCAFKMATEKQMYTSMCKHYGNVLNGDKSLDSHYKALRDAGFDLGAINNCVENGHDEYDLAMKQTERMEIPGTPHFRAFDIGVKNDTVNLALSNGIDKFMCDYLKSPCCGCRCP